MGRVKKEKKELNILGSALKDSLKSEKVTRLMKCMVEHDPQ